MSYPAPCAACERGDHEHHVAHTGPPGGIGGSDCNCYGLCAPPDLMAALRASVDEAKRAREARPVGTGNPTQPRADD